MNTITISIDSIEYDIFIMFYYDELKIKEIKIYRDGGTTELSYDDGGTSEWANIKYTIIKCRRLDGNRDMYICKSGTTLNDLDI